MASARTGGALVSSLGWSWEDTEEKGLAAESQERDARVSWSGLCWELKGEWNQERQARKARARSYREEEDNRTQVDWV
jgi:hypothetical protein